MVAEQPVTPLISVIIPAWNGEARIGQCLDALAEQSFPRDRFEVIVIDNASTDRTATIAGEYPFVTLLHEPQPGSYRARNRGLAVARGEYLLFTDADCVPDRDWISAAAQRIETHPHVGVHAGRVKLFREPGAGPFASRYEELVAFDQKGNAAGGFCVTANWLCRRDLLESIGGFNAEMLSGGDADCSRRVIAAGHSLEYAPAMIVGHPTRASALELVRKRRRVVGGRWLLEGWAQVGLRTSTRHLLREAWNEARWIKNSSIEGWAKPGVLAVSAVLALAGQYEIVRLKAGREAYRS